MIHTAATKRVQRGTKRPSGNTQKNTPKDASPTKYKRSTGRSSPGYTSASQCKVSACTVPNVTSATEAYRATRWPELFQKSIAPINQYPRTETTLRATL